MSEDQKDWPPIGSATTLPEGTERRGSTGQLWVVRDHQWKRQQELPVYQCYKKVRALKIDIVSQNPDGTGYLVPIELGYATIKVTHAYFDKHNPVAGGYYVLYEDGYESYSPAKAFEEGYTRIK